MLFVVLFRLVLTAELAELFSRPLTIEFLVVFRLLLTVVLPPPFPGVVTVLFVVLLIFVLTVVLASLLTRRLRIPFSVFLSLLLMVVALLLVVTVFRATRTFRVRADRANCTTGAPCAPMSRGNPNRRGCGADQA